MEWLNESRYRHPPEQSLELKLCSPGFDSRQGKPELSDAGMLPKSLKCPLSDPEHSSQAAQSLGVLPCIYPLSFMPNCQWSCQVNSFPQYRHFADSPWDLFM